MCVCVWVSCKTHAQAVSVFPPNTRTHTTESERAPNLHCVLCVCMLCARTPYRKDNLYSSGDNIVLSFPFHFSCAPMLLLCNGFHQTDCFVRFGFYFLFVHYVMRVYWPFLPFSRLITTNDDGGNRLLPITHTTLCIFCGSRRRRRSSSSSSWAS